MTGRARVWDWLIGAVGMLVLLGIAVVIFWLSLSTPAGSTSEASPSSEAAEPLAEGPPADLGDDDVWFGDLTLDSDAAVAAGSELSDVEAFGRNVVSGAGGLIAGQLTVDATVPFQVVADELGEDTEIRAAENGQVGVVRTVEVLGRDVLVTATGTVDVQRGVIVVEPTSIDVGGPDFLADTIAAVVRRFVTIEHGIEGLPEGLELRTVQVIDDGFRANLSGEDVNLGQ